MDDVPSLFARAAAAQKAGDRPAAAWAFEAVLRIDPEQPQALNALGVMALDAGEATRAAGLFARATARDAKAAPLWINLAKARRALGDDEGERAALNGALAADRAHFMALLRMAELQQRLGEEAEAAGSWAAALAVAPPSDRQPPQLAETLAHGREFVERRTALLADAIDAGTAEARAAAGSGTRRFDAALAHTLGRRPIYINNCAGLHFPFLPADEFFPREHFPWMAELEAATPAIRAELAALLAGGEQGFAPYVDLPSGTPETIWSGLDKSPRWNACFFWQYGERREEACARCPATAAAIARVPLADIPGRGPTAFFSVLKPRTRIPAHTGVSNIRTTVHLPLVVPDGCAFRVGGETRPWREGEAFAFDDTIEHEAWNDGDQPRTVLILDVWNPHLTAAERDLLRAFYRAADASGHRPEPAWQP